MSKELKLEDVLVRKTGLVEKGIQAEQTRCIKWVKRALTEARDYEIAGYLLDAARLLRQLQSDIESGC